MENEADFGRFADFLSLMKWKVELFSKIVLTNGGALPDFFRDELPHY